MRHPRAVRVGDAHARASARRRRRPRRAGQASGGRRVHGHGRVLDRRIPRAVGEHPFGPVGVDARHDVEGAGAQRLCDQVVAVGMTGDESLDQRSMRRPWRSAPRRGCWRRPSAPASCRGCRSGVGHGDEPEVATFVRRAVRLELDQVGVLLGDGVQPRHQLVVPQIPVDPNVIARRSWRPTDHKRPGVSGPYTRADAAGVAHAPVVRRPARAAAARDRRRRRRRTSHAPSNAVTLADTPALDRITRVSCTRSSPPTARRSACRPTTTWATARSATTRSAPGGCSPRAPSW